MKNRYSLTLFTYNPQMSIEKTTLKDRPHAPVRKGPTIGERPIYKILAEYGFLNTNLIQRCLTMRGNGKVKAAKSLEKLQAYGKVDKYTIKCPGSHKQNIDLYTLSESTRAFLKKKGEPMVRYRYDMEDIPYILERMSVAQWHIAVLESSVIHECAYGLRVALQDGRTTVIPSLTAHRTVFGQKVYLCGVCVPKGGTKEDLAKFLKNVYLMDSYFRQEKMTYRSYIFVLICEDDRQSEEVCRYLTGITETAGIYFLYTNDAATSSELRSPISLLYDINLKGDLIERKVVSIPTTSIEALRKSKHKMFT